MLVVVDMLADIGLANSIDILATKIAVRLAANLPCR
jgi:hypothetical protein